MPTVIKLNGHRFALLQHEEFIIGLACREDIPDGFSIVCTRNNEFLFSLCTVMCVGNYNAFCYNYFRKINKIFL